MPLVFFFFEMFKLIFNIFVAADDALMAVYVTQIMIITNS